MWAHGSKTVQPTRPRTPSVGVDPSLLRRVGTKFGSGEKFLLFLIRPGHDSGTTLNLTLHEAPFEISCDVTRVDADGNGPNYFRL